MQSHRLHIWAARTIVAASAFLLGGGLIGPAMLAQAAPPILPTGGSVETGVPWWVWLLVGILILAGIAVVVIILRRRQEEEPAAPVEPAEPVAEPPAPEEPVTE